MSDKQPAARPRKSGVDRLLDIGIWLSVGWLLLWVAAVVAIIGVVVWVLVSGL